MNRIQLAQVQPDWSPTGQTSKHDAKVQIMNTASSVVSGAFVLLSGLWYLALPNMVTCEDMQTGEVLTGCVEVMTPLITYFCATPPLVLAVLFHTMRNGEKSSVQLHTTPIDAEGRAVISPGAPGTNEQVPLRSYAAWGMTIGGFSMAGAYCLTFIFGLFIALPLLALAGMSYGSSSDADFEWLVNPFKVLFFVMRVGFWLFAASAIAKFVLDRGQNLQDGPPHKSAKIMVPCPSCGAKLNVPTNYSGQVQCPKCQHVFETGEG